MGVRQDAEGPREPAVRRAVAADVPAVCAFGATHVPPHYAPLIGAEAAAAQVRDWWGEDAIATAVADGLVVVAEEDGQVVGVAQRGRWGTDHVVWKLYVAPEHRGTGLGPRLLDALLSDLPADAERVLVEHFAGNARAGAFYEREGFTVDRVEPSPGGDPARAVVWRSRRSGG
ncbi:N-acetyltransferase family protein [Nocardioides sp. CPCC 205120]|uniref:GNAT family N-acetyltransferase n=1 Tax=Nocardioides sp. CPCC 205120 TaxID=3406462 RepID=UPI003B503493